MLFDNGTIGVMTEIMDCLTQRTSIKDFIECRIGIVLHFFDVVQRKLIKYDSFPIVCILFETDNRRRYYDKDRYYNTTWKIVVWL